MHTSWYNNLIRDEGLVATGTLKTLPEPCANLNDGAVSYCNSLLIGNTKNVWPEFLDWLASRIDEKKRDSNGVTDAEALERISSPFDSFVEESILTAIQTCCCEYGKEIASCELFWSNGKRQKVNVGQMHDPTRGDDASAPNNYHCYDDKENSFLVSMQRVATTTGEYWHDSEATKLCVHPEYGSWTAFRCVVVFESRDLECPVPAAPRTCPCPVTDEENKLAKSVFDYALNMSTTEEGYGATLNKPWEELCQYLHETVCSGSDWEKVPATLKPWMQLRDCISVGREKWKYSQAQLLYHYTRDPAILAAEMHAR